MHDAVAHEGYDDGADRDDNDGSGDGDLVRRADGLQRLPTHDRVHDRPSYACNAVEDNGDQSREVAEGEARDGQLAQSCR